MAIHYSRSTDPKRVSRFKKKMRIRRRITGSAERPRLSIYKSLSHLYAQLIDDSTGVTLVSASTVDKKMKGIGAGMESAKGVGAELAKRALAQKIESAVFDRNGFRYHGKIKVLADAAREAGLRF